MSHDFMENYINDCVAEGITSPKQICEKVLIELDVLDKELAHSNDLRIKRKYLVNILKDFEHDSMKKFKKINNVLNINEMIENDDPSYKEFLSDICLFIDGKTNVSKREIMDQMGGLEQNQLVYMGIKWLCDHGILITNEDRTLSVGENWESRPKLETSIAV